MKHLLSRAAAFIVLSLSLHGVAQAQALRVPALEVGGQGGLIGVFGEGVFVQPVGGPRLTVNIAQHHAIELVADTMLSDGGGIHGLYFLQYKHVTRRPPDWRGVRPFVTAGTGGYYAYQRVPELRSPRADGSAIVYPAYSTGELSRFTVAAFGGGFERALSRYASFRLEGTGFLVLGSEGFPGFRVLAGVSIPIGGYRVSHVQ